MNTQKTQILEIKKYTEANVLPYIAECEKNYQNQIKTIIDEIANNENIKFILLSGPSSSGKTTTSKLLTKYLQEKGKKALPVSLDDYFLGKDKIPVWDDGELNFETADSLDWELFGRCMNDLLNNKEVKLPLYNFATSSTEYHESTKIENNTIVIVEGLHALNPIIDKYIPVQHRVKVFISVNTDVYNGQDMLLQHREVRLIRRAIRDTHSRATTIDETVKMWKKVQLGENLYISPFKHTAQYYINSFHPYELCVYKEIIASFYGKLDKEFMNIINKLEVLPELPVSIVPKDSLLQEFVPNLKD